MVLERMVAKSAADGVAWTGLWALGRASGFLGSWALGFLGSPVDNKPTKSSRAMSLDPCPRPPSEQSRDKRQVAPGLVTTACPLPPCVAVGFPPQAVRSSGDATGPSSESGPIGICGFSSVESWEHVCPSTTTSYMRCERHRQSHRRVDPRGDHGIRPGTLVLDALWHFVTCCTGRHTVARPSICKNKSLGKSAATLQHLHARAILGNRARGTYRQEARVRGRPG